MCQYYNLHNTAVFQPAAEQRHNDRIVNEFRLTKFFFGRKCQTVSRSSYSGRLTVQTAEVRPHNTLSLSLDQDRIRDVAAQLLQLTEERKGLEAAIAAATEDLRTAEATLEASRRAHRELENRRCAARVAVAKLEAARQKLRGLLAAGSGVEEEGRRLAAGRQAAVRLQTVCAAALAKTIAATARVRLETEVKQLTGAPLQPAIEELTEQLSGLKEEMAEMRGQLATAEQELNEAKSAMMDLLKSAKAVTGLEPGTRDRPPAAMREFWEKVTIGIQFRSVNFPLDHTMVNIP
jgi:DNA repair exonuclease SbcCD ATPase subunit